METDLHHVTVSVTATSHTNTSRTATMVSRGIQPAWRIIGPTLQPSTTRLQAVAQVHGRTD